MLNFNSEPRSDRVIVAFDCDKKRAFELADMLSGHAKWVKVGMTLFYQEGPAIVKELKDRGFNVFLDLKFHDIPHQVEGAARSAISVGADMVTMHAIGGVEMMKAAKKGVDDAAQGNNPITLAVTVLTSMNKETLNATGVSGEIIDQIRRLALQAQEACLTGVVASPHEANMLRELLDSDAFIVTPGVRPTGASLDDQSRVMTPKEAFDQGASHIVIGRPVTGASDPRAAFDEIVKGL